MDDIIFLIDIAHNHSIIRVIELNLVYDEDYRENMYVGSDGSETCGYHPDDIILDDRESSDSFTYYFTDNLDVIERDIDKNHRFEYHKLL